jgi:hypothetical protein
MRVTEPQLRTLLLAQAIEQTDARHTLVSAVELQDATRSAVAAARARGLPRVGVAEVMLERATTVANHASGRDSTVAALHARHIQRPGTGGLGPWVARGLPLAALLLGLAIDRISNAHRVDLLSPPLLTVLAWNLAVYLLIAWRAMRPPQAPGAWLQQALRPLHHPFGRAERGRGLAARIAADFHQRWWAHAAGLLQQRVARVLHLCAAAWGAGIALSLLLRGLVVRYQFGWESTFLDATQVHAIVSVLFAPLTLLPGLAPFTLQEIAATQNFAGESGAAGMGGAAGSRWVGMYVGLLLLAVVLPRLALAAWARWREHRWQGHIDPQGAAFDTLRASLPGDLVIGLHGPQAQTLVLLGSSLQTPEGDHLRFTDHTGQPVDAVLAWADDPIPPAWQAAPHVALRWEDFGASWVLEPRLFNRLSPTLPAQHHALARLRAAWVERNELRFGQALQALAQHLGACAALTRLPPDAAAVQYADQVRVLDATLRALHGEPTAPAMPSAQLAPPLPAPRRIDGTALALGTSAGAAAGAAAGAKAGALIDLGTGGLTLGAGTALGALLGGTTAWVVRSLQKRDAGRQDLLQHAAEAACSHYLAIAHQQRMPLGDAAPWAARWHAEVTGTVAAHGAALAAALQDGAHAEALTPLLRTVLMGILQRSCVREGSGTAPAGSSAG